MKIKVKASEQELEEILGTVPFSALRNEGVLGRYCIEHKYNRTAIARILEAVSMQAPLFRLAVLKRETGLTFDGLNDLYEDARVHFIIIRRVNHILHATMLDVYDILEKRDMIRFSVKKHYQKTESLWKKYNAPIKKHSDDASWYTMQDHLNITHDMLRPRIERLFESVRDYMIRLEWRDVELKARIEVVMMIAKVAYHSFNAFFREYEKESGIDLSRCFADSSLTQMTMEFARMSDALGFRTVNDKFGLPDIQGFDVNASIRIRWAWDAFINDLKDDDLMDESSLQAIELNPSIAEEYHRQMEEEERNRVIASVDRLTDKYKVTKQKNKE